MLGETVRRAPNDAGANQWLANSLTALGRYDEAIASVEAAAALEPDSLLSGMDWGRALFLAGRADAALAKIKDVIAAEPEHYWGYVLRGVIYFSLGQIERAETDFQAARELAPNGLYPVIWLAVARERRDKTNIQDLRTAAAESDPKRWPGPVLRFVLGDIGAEAVLADARNAPPHKQNEQECEAFFFIGESYLRDGDRELAAEYFQRAIDTGVRSYTDTGVRSYIEYAAAVVALRHLGKAS